MNRFDEFTRERQYLMNVSDHTIRWYRCALKWLPNENPTEDQLNSMVIRMRERGLKATGCNAAIRAINCYLRWSGSPHTVQFLKEPKLVLPTFTNEQVRLLIKYKPKTQFQHRLHLLVMILMDTGCRISEALALHHEDIDLDNMLMKLHGKGDQDRLVPISFQLRKLLFKVEKGPLFRTVNGTAWKRIGALRSVKLHCQKLGFEPPVRTLHAIRHTFATAYLRHGGSVFHLQKMLGHSSLEMSRRYANLSTTDLSAVHKVCPIRRFEANAFEEKRVCLDQQQTFEGMNEEVATTTIRSSGTRPGFEDFRQYIIEHDRVVKMPGRYGNIRFPEFTYTGTIAGFYSEKRGLMLLSGKKADVLSLAATTTRVAEFQIDTLHVDMNALQDLLPSVNLVWFKFKRGMIRASALMGANVEKTDTFAQSKSEGEISTLSFYFEDLSGDKHPVMITEDGAVVLQSQYVDVATELNLITLVHDKLLNSISQKVSPKANLKTFSVSQTPP